MKRFGLIVTSIVLVLLCGVLLARVAWADSPASVVPESRAASATALSGAAGWHYRHSQPTHWRACMLQP